MLHFKRVSEWHFQSSNHRRTELIKGNEWSVTMDNFLPFFLFRRSVVVYIDSATEEYNPAYV